MPPGSRMLYWLAVTCRKHRDVQGVKQSRVAALLDADQTTVTRFEQGVVWPRDADKTVTAYSEALNIDARRLWQEAIELWRKHGTEPNPAT